MFNKLSSLLLGLNVLSQLLGRGYRGIRADVIVYIFAHLHTTLRTEENLLGMY